MGMSSDMAPRYLSVNPSGQVTYVLDASTVSLAQVHLAVPASEVLLIQDEGKPVALSESPILVADVGTENVNWLGNNVIVLVSQQQEVMIVNPSSSVISNSGQQWQEEVASATAAIMPGTQYVAKMLPVNSDDDWSTNVQELSPSSAVENARGWFRDSLISAAALSSLATLAHTSSKNG